jgi:ribosomal protection tetracycline resistance protein
MNKKEIITIGILAHVDAGKTSLTECLLYKSGATKIRGSVDKGSAITDGLSVEKNRGISIKTATVDLVWQQRHINIVDTPGHIDFSAEVDRALNILDMIILVVSAKEGVQAHTLNLWETILERKLPVLIFVNKIDRAGADLDQVFFDLEKDLGIKLFALNYGDNSQNGDPKVVDFIDVKPYLSSPIYEKSFENLAEFDEEFLEEYLEGNINDLEGILKKTHLQMQSQKLIGLLFGSAKLDLGIDLILDEVATLYSTNNNIHDGPSAKVFKVEYDAKMGRLAHIKSYGSAIKTKDVFG